MYDRTQGIRSRQTPNRSGTVDSVEHGTGRVKQKPRSVEIVFLGIEERACLRRKLPCLKAVGHGEGQVLAPDHLLRVFPRVHRGGDHIHIEIFQRMPTCLEISQLQMTDRSPYAPVYEEDTVGICRLVWEGA